MKHLSMIGLITCLAFTPAGKPSSLSVGHSSSVKPADFVKQASVVANCKQTAANWVEAPDLTDAKLQQQYFWFFYPGDYYWDHKTLADEINEMWMLYGAPVDTHPNGSLIDRGYWTDAYPHIGYAQVYLYVHY